MARYVKGTVPAWKDFKIKSCGTYLGFEVGHTGGTFASWRRPLEKFSTRAKELGACGLAPSVGTRLFEQNVSTTLAYVEQLCEPPSALKAAVQSAIERTMHAPHNTFPGNSAFCVGEAGMVSFTSLVWRGTAARIRAASITCSEWRVAWAELDLARREYGPACNQVANLEQLVDFPRWQSCAFVDVLARASLRDFGEADKSKKKGLQAAVAQFIKPVFFPGDLADEVAPPLERYFAKFLFEGDLLKVATRETRTVVKNMAPSTGWALLRTWLNGWITSTRFGNPDAGCKFGCRVEEDDGSADRVPHYIDCEVLWQTVLELVLREYGVTWAEQRWNVLVLSPPDLAFESFRHREKLIVLAVAVGAFHFLNAQIRGRAPTGIITLTAPFHTLRRSTASVICFASHCCTPPGVRHFVF